MTEDERLALELQEEEAREWNARMLALAGVPPDAAMGGDGNEEEQDEEDRPLGLDVDAMSYEQLLELGDAVGAVSRGCDPHVVASLPVSTWSPPSHGASAMPRTSPGAGSAAVAEEALCVVCRME